MTTDTSVSRTPTFTFHPKCGYNVTLSDENRTAESRNHQNENGGIVVGTKPMVVNMLYEVEIDKLWRIRPTISAPFPVGVVTASPDDKLIFPHSDRAFDCADLFENYGPHDGTCSWKQAIVLVRERLYTFGSESVAYNDKLRHLPVGTRVGVCLNTERRMCVYRDGQMVEKEISRGLPHPVYPLFHLTRDYRQITTLPVTPIRNDEEKSKEPS